MDTMILTIIASGVCGALLIMLLGKWVAEELYHMEVHGGQSYVIDTGVEDEAEEEVVEIPFAEVFAVADIDKGEKVFNKCKACHKLDVGANGTGPYLHGIVGREVASADGFGYSGNLVAVVDVWSPEALDQFLANPSGYAPGTTMAYAGLKKLEDRANLIAYLDQTSE